MGGVCGDGQGRGIGEKGFGEGVWGQELWGEEPGGGHRTGRALGGAEATPLSPPNPLPQAAPTAPRPRRVLPPAPPALPQPDAPPSHAPTGPRRAGTRRAGPRHPPGPRASTRRRSRHRHRHPPARDTGTARCVPGARHGSTCRGAGEGGEDPPSSPTGTAKPAMPPAPSRHATRHRARRAGGGRPGTIRSLSRSPALVAQGARQNGPILVVAGAMGCWAA